MKVGPFRKHSRRAQSSRVSCIMYVSCILGRLRGQACMAGCSDSCSLCALSLVQTGIFGGIARCSTNGESAQQNTLNDFSYALNIDDGCIADECVIKTAAVLILVSRVKHAGYPRHLLI